MNRFDNKVIIITNADTGIGAATAKRFILEGASVVLNACHKESLREMTNGISGRRILLHEGNVSERAYIERLVEETVSQFGRLDVLINNIQSASSKQNHGDTTERLLKMTEQLHKVTPSDVDCVFQAVRSALPHLLHTRGAVVNVLFPPEVGIEQGGSSYNSARGAVSRLTRTVAGDLAGEGVRVNVVSPRLTSMVLAGDFENSDSFYPKSGEVVSIGRGASAEEVAGVIAFLASEDASFVNGIDLPVDGGFTAVHRAATA
ncbi:dehydrogenase of unknown specificity, short-chain alcohol dehydrogenase like protein [Terriglobus roseus DSM 18391]|uniref:NAD(P)-dependent dehydrogenase, short-chain alcohol dehydrogenase family n=1 Tax=Terriglobus roseus (strain DSM 18391 / NRRL B-41598 / KBS 63) TaxID=926566 RepID=I3ZE12_TERRK|nr:SDR family oxidoreductase [Terriglobus roseus]AFL87480.1 dehydrogenase of unknown specificity, short-chain alcohol dehydrogenase like protein [Terriglobus roseus DSM 18391]